MVPTTYFIVFWNNGSYKILLLASFTVSNVYRRSFGDDSSFKRDRMGTFKRFIKMCFNHMYETNLIKK